MGAAEDFLARQQSGKSGATVASAPVKNNPFAPSPGFLGGMLASTLSAIPEMIGADPTEAAAQFRAANPWTGFATEMLPTLGAYGAVAKVSELPAIASRLEKGTAAVAERLGLGSVEAAPIRSSMIRETLRFAPFEASKLAVGGMVYPDHIDNLFADAALNMGFTVGGIGLLGGLFRAAGKVIKGDGKIIGSDMYAAPTFELRQSLQPSVELAGTDLTLAEKQAKLVDQVYRERMPKGGVSNKELPVISNAVGATSKEDLDMLNNLFKLDGKGGKNEENLITKSFAESEKPKDGHLDPGQREKIIQKLGFEDDKEFASTVQFPRVHEIPTARAANQLAKTLDLPVFNSAGPDVRWGRAKDGLFTVSVRLESGKTKAAEAAVAAGEDPAVAAAQKARARGQSKVAPGDRWVTFLTDQPGKFAPELQKVADGTVASWARWRPAWQPPRGNNDVFSAANDLVMRSVGVQGYQDLKRMSKQSFVAKYADDVAGKLADRAGITDSKVIRDTLDYAYDVLKPTMFKEYQDSLYGRLFGMLKGNVTTAERYVHQMMRGVAKVKGSGYGVVFNPKNALDLSEGFMGHEPVLKQIYKLSKGDVNDVIRVTGSRLPIDSVDALVTDGAITAKAGDFLKYLDTLDSDFNNTVVLPALRPLGERNNFELFKGPYLHRAWEGDHRIQVVDEQGREQFLAARKTGPLAQRDAKVVIEEAAKQGKTWRMQELKHITDEDAEAVTQAMQKAYGQMEAGSDSAKVLQSAIKRISNLDNRAALSTKARKPTDLKERSGRQGSPDLMARQGEYTHEDLANIIEGHYTKLSKFAARQAWQERFGSEAFILSTRDKTLYQDLMRKANQYIGVQGTITRALNKSLDPLLAPIMGKNAATKIAAATNEVMYHMQLAFFNPSFAVLNALTPVMTVLPQIAYTLRTPRFEALKFYDVHPTFDQFGKPLGVGGQLQPLKVLWQAYKDASSPSDELKAIYGRAIDDGALAAQLRDEVTGPHSASFRTMNDMWKSGEYLSLFREGSTYMANKSEQFARLIALNAGYRVGKDVVGLEGDSLYHFVRRFSEVANFNYGVVDRSRIFTGPVGSMFGLFKNWQMHYMGMVANYAKAGWQQNTWSPLLWQNAAALAIGGLGATPLVHLADGLSNWYSGDKDSYLWMQKNWHEGADNIWFGLPSFLGVSLQASASIPGTDVRNEVSSLGNFVIIERGKAIGKALGYAASYQSASGQNALTQPNIRDKLMGAILPRSMYRIASVMEGDYVKSMATGSPMVRGTSPAVQMMHGMGFNMVEVERYQVAAKRLYEEQEAVSGLSICRRLDQVAGRAVCNTIRPP
jgi:hypothetical protein